MNRLLAAASIAAALAAAACDTRPATAEWQDVCADSHTEVVSYMPQQIGGVTTITPIYGTVCDRRETRCIAGRDGSTVCQPLGGSLS